MGMYNGSFNVIDEPARSAATSTLTTTTTSPNTSTSPSTNTTAPSCGANGGSCGCGATKSAIPQNPAQSAVQPITQGNVQVLKATYTSAQDISPNSFTVKANQPVRFEILAKEDGQGCMGSITLPGLTNKVDVFTKGQTLAFEFTPTKTGSYNITCAMGVPRGQIKVI